MQNETALQRQLSRFAKVEPRETAAVVAAFCLFFFVLGSYFAVRPVRETVATLLGRDRVADLWSTPRQDRREASCDSGLRDWRRGIRIVGGADDVVKAERGPALLPRGRAWPRVAAAPGHVRLRQLCP